MTGPMLFLGKLQLVIKGETGVVDCPHPACTAQFAINVNTLPDGLMLSLQRALDVRAEVQLHCLRVHADCDLMG
jgi:hypothetical protein